MTQHAAYDLILAGLRIEEHLAPGVPEKMHVHLQASVSQYRPRNLKRQCSG